MTVPSCVPLADVAAVHVDDPVAEPDVGGAARAIAAADTGDEDAALVVALAEDHELAWYATQELPELLT